MKQILYKKMGSRRYVPVSEYDPLLTDALPKGAHLICVYPGGQSTKYHVNIAHAPLIAAARIAKDKMTEAMQKVSEARPATKILTPEQQLAWKHMKEAYGDEIFYLTYPSHYEIAEAGIDVLIDEADKLMKNPAVKKAYEHFLLLCELTKEETND